MAINNYSTLVSAATEWLARDQDTFVTARIPDFITIAEAKLNRLLLHPKMETRTTLTVDTGLTEPEFLSLPSDYQSMRRARLSGVTGKPQLAFLTQTQLEDYRFSIENVTDQPIYYTIIGTQMELAPTPNQNYDIEINYRANIPGLTSSNTTNWLLTLAPDLYLFGVLLASTTHTPQDQDKVTLWGAGFQTALDEVNEHGNRQSFDAGPSTIWLPGITP